LHWTSSDTYNEKKRCGRGGSKKKASRWKRKEEKGNRMEEEMRKTENRERIKEKAKKGVREGHS
jgi:hypothetical protein